MRTTIDPAPKSIPPSSILRAQRKQRNVRGVTRGVTHDDIGDPTTEDETVRAKHPDIVFSLDDPLRNRNLVLALLRPVRVPVLCQVLARDLVGKCLVRFGEFDELRVGFFLSLILRELDFVRVAMRLHKSATRTEMMGGQRFRTIATRAFCNVS